MSRSLFIIAVSALVSSTFAIGQQTQPQNGNTSRPGAGQPVQPSSAVYNRMRRFPQQGDAQSTVQAGQYPNPAQTFPPEQQAPFGQRPPMTFPHATEPLQQTPPAPQQPSPAQPPQQVSPPAQMQAPYGLALQPANPPRISYVGGQLTVVADNSSLHDVIGSIAKVTGAEIEGSQPDSERVFGKFGPGTPREVLDSLLTGSPYDFILVGAVEDPGNVRKVLLTKHGTPLAGALAANNEPQRSGAPTPPEEEEGTDTAPTVVPEPVQQVAPPEQPQQSPNQPQVKTPEQLLQELQRLRQQQQQQQQGNTTPR